MSGHVIFVHGLDGEAFSTWLSGSSKKEFWPEWLTDDLPQLDIWSLGYEATSTWWKQGGAMALPDRAQNLLPLLANEPGLAEGDIYFIVHSLGGLVVESILQLAEVQAPQFVAVGSFLRRSRKIAFIGTPHVGSDQAGLVNRLRIFLWPRATVGGLSSDDAHLRGLNTWFRGFAFNNNLDVMVLREDKRVSFLGIPGLGGTVVKPGSADPGLPPTAEIIPLGENHLSMVAPKNREAEVYQHLVRFLGRPVESHADTLLADSIIGIEEVVKTQVRELSSQSREQNTNVVAAIDLPQAPVDDGFMFAGIGRALVDGFPEVDPVVDQLVEEAFVDQLVAFVRESTGSPSPIRRSRLRIGAGTRVAS